MPIAIGTYTITDVYDGTNGKDSIIAVLSNESHTLPANSAGTVSSFSGAATTMYIYKGATDDSANWTVAAGTPVGIGGGLVGKTYTVNAMSADTGYVDLTATPVGGGASITKRFTLSKSKQGTGGTNGNDAYIYRLTPSVYAIKNVGGTFTPTSITFSATRAQGTGNPSAYAGRFIIAESSDGVNFTNRYTSTVEESSKAHTPTGNTVRFVRATLYLAGGTTTKLDEQTTPVVSDGANGADGKGVTAVIDEFYLSDSSSTQTGGSWVTTPPTWSVNKFLWIRQKVTYTDSSVGYTTPYRDASWDSLNSSVSILNTAVNVSNGKITGAIDSASITTTANGTTTMQSFANNIVADTSGLKVSVSELKTKLNNNLIVNSGHFSELGGWATSSDATISNNSFDFTDANHFFVAEPSISVPAGGNIIGDGMNKDIPIEGNKTYIFSAWIKFGNSFTTTAYQPLGFYLNTSRGGTSTVNGGGLAVLTEDRTIVSGSWKRYYVRFKTSSAQTVYYITPLVDGKTGTTAPYLIGNMMLEKVDDAQTAPSPWVESIAETSYATSQLSIQKDMILSKVEKDGIIAAIELLPDSATISASRIAFNGEVTVSEYLGNIDGLIAEEDRASVKTTVIKGDRIQTGSITAKQLDTNNFSVTDANKNTTFQINPSGDVMLSGEIKSTGFDADQNIGYLLEKNGNAVLNNATLRGNLMLPNAGVTNFGGKVGGENLLRNSSFLNGRTFWSVGTVVPDGYEGDPALELKRTNWVSGNSRFQSAHNFSTLPFVAGDTITLSGWVYIDSSVAIDTGSNNMAVRLYKTDGSFSDIASSLFNSLQKDKWNYVQAQGVVPTGFNPTNGTNSVLLSISQNGYFKFSRLKLEKGDKGTVWSPSALDGLNEVRFWAGTDYATRREAPFRVYQDGSVHATKGTFGGTITGSLSIGNVHIQDTNESNGFIRFMDNNNLNTLIDLNESESYFNTSFTLGSLNDRKLYFDKTNSRLAVNIDSYFDKQIFVKDEITLSKGNTSVETIVDTTGKYKIVHNGQKTNVTDPHILIQSGVGKVDVEIDGSLQVDDEIRMSGTVRMVSRANGIDFVVS